MEYAHHFLPGTDARHIEHASLTGTDRIELYTEPYAAGYALNREEAIAPFVRAAVIAGRLGWDSMPGMT
jgi:pyridoxine 5-phosphate synthase